MIVNLIILCLIIITCICLWFYKECDTKLKYIMLSFGAILFIIQLQKLVNNNMNENFTPAEADEALQNIASMYNDKEKLTVKNLKVTGNIEVSGKSSFGDDITGAKNLTISGDTSIKNLTADDTTIKKTLLFAPRDNPSGAVSWKMFNSGDRLHTRSNVADSGGSFIENDYAGKGSINTHWYQPNGGTRLVVGTNTHWGINQSLGAARSNGYVDISFSDGTRRWQIGDDY